MMIRSGSVFLLVVIIFLLFTAGVEHRPATAIAQDSSAAISQNRRDRTKYVGDSACLGCHKEESLSYRRTSHHLTSQPATRDTILGSFAKSSNILTILSPEKTSDNPRLYFEMEDRTNGFYETAVAEMGSKVLSQSQRIDIVIGSGVRGQTYLYWSADRLYELPVSYWTDGHQWINSPGYQDQTANFSRRADPRCIECHATYIKALSSDPQTNIYDRSSLVPGISCESCHGPGAAHVAQQRSTTTGSSVSKQTIVNPAHLDRKLQVDQCALCHNGTSRQEITGAFSFIPGQSLDRYFASAPFDASVPLDVHGNQVGLLERSRCFLSSPSMTCSTCHNVHAPELSAADYSHRCLTCHRWESCGEAKKLGNKISQNCIDCHMPLVQTNAIVSVTAGRVLRTTIRNHWIKIYPGAETAEPHIE
jgi:hypothetical protein